MAPLLVLVGQAIGQPMDLDFNPFEEVAVAISHSCQFNLWTDALTGWREHCSWQPRALGAAFLSSSLIDNLGYGDFYKTSIYRDRESNLEVQNMQ